MDFTPARSTPNGQRYVREGFWDDQTLGSLLADGLREAAASRSPSVPIAARTAARSATSTRSPGGSRPGCARGVQPGDAIAFQLPNWLEAAATFYAIAYLGAVVVPIVHFYGPKEVSYILARTRVKALVTADRFGAQDFLANLDTMRGDLPDLEWVAVVGDEPGPPGDLAFDELVADEPLDEMVKVDPSAPALVAYTSGTTSDPKGVVHAHRTIGAEIRQLGGIQPFAGLDQRREAARAVGRAAVDHGRAGRPRHRHDRGAADAGARPAADPPDRRVGSGPRAAGDARRRLLGRAGLHVLPHEPARPSRLRSRAPRSR